MVITHTHTLIPLIFAIFRARSNPVLTVWRLWRVWVWRDAQACSESGADGQRSRKLHSAFNLCWTYAIRLRWTLKLDIQDRPPLSRLLNKRWNLKNHDSQDRPDKAAAASVWVRDGRTTRGSKMPALLHNPQPHSDPLSGLTETGQAPTMRWCAGTRPPGGSSRQLRNVRIEIRQGLQLEGEFQPSSALSSACLVFCISVVPVCLCCHPGLVFSYCSCSRATGSRRPRHPSVTGN